MPSEIRDNIDSEIDELINGLLTTEDFHKRPSASAAAKILHKVIGSSNGVSAPAIPETDEEAPPAFEIGSVVDGVYRIEQDSGAARFSGYTRSSLWITAGTTP